MKKFTINGVEFNNFGPNNYSDGMELVTVNNPSKDFVQRVLKGEFHGIYLNPSAPSNDEEFFGVFGTKKQYSEFYKRQREAQIIELLIKKFGSWAQIAELDNEEFRRAKKEIESTYKDWWEKQSYQSLSFSFQNQSLSM